MTNELQPESDVVRQVIFQRYESIQSVIGNNRRETYYSKMSKISVPLRDAANLGPHPRIPTTPGKPTLSHEHSMRLFVFKQVAAVLGRPSQRDSAAKEAACRFIAAVRLRVNERPRL